MALAAQRRFSDNSPYPAVFLEKLADVDVDVTLKTANDEVLRKIGRNMLLFQKMEALLKYLLAHNGFAGTVDTLQADRNQRVAAVQKKTLGQLVNDYVDYVYGDEAEPPELAALDKPHVRFGFRIDSSQGDPEAHSARLAAIVAERNELIHHLLPRYNPASEESCRAIDAQLDAQRQKLLPELNDLKAQVRTLGQARQLLAEFFQSEDGHRLLEEGLWPGESRLAGLLRKVVKLAARPDGWASLATAGQLIAQQDAETLAKLHQELGVTKLQNLKRLIETTPGFELREEPTRGGSHWLFRRVPESDERRSGLAADGGRSVILG